MNELILKNLVDKNLSSYAIAKELNISQTTVRYWLAKYKLKTNYRWASKVQTTPLGEYKKCPKCQELKNLHKDYYFRKDGRFHGWCKKCNDRITLNKQKERKRLMIEYKGGKCHICNYDKCDGALEFHHLDPTQKDYKLSNLKNYSLEKLKPELDKCICVCANCHREIHAGLINLNGTPGQA